MYFRGFFENTSRNLGEIFRSLEIFDFLIYEYFKKERKLVRAKTFFAFKNEGFAFGKEYNSTTRECQEENNERRGEKSRIFVYENLIESF